MAALLPSPILSGRSGDLRLLISCEREVGHRHSWPLLRAVTPAPESPASLLRLAASAAVFLSVGVRACTACHLPSSPTARTVMEHLPPPSVMEDKLEDPAGGRDSDVVEISEDEFKSAFDKWRSKTYALTVPLRIIALRGSLPPAWIKDFVQVQGKRLKLQTEFRGSLDAIFQELSSSLRGHVGLKSAIAADIVTIADSWLDSAIRGGMIEPLEDAEKQEWFNCLSNKWKIHLCRNARGEIDPKGKIWGAPYRWGCMVIAYKKSKFKNLNLSPIEDWGDLWRPELAGKISMVDAPREVVGAVLKYIGASYNTQDFETEVNGGRDAVIQNLTILQRQVRLFDSVHYLKAFGAGEVWVAVGWSSDILPAAKRLSDVAVIVPKSGTSLWADLWAVPAATSLITNHIGGRVRGPSPLIHQWFEFCLQAARAMPFQQEVIPGSLPLALEDSSLSKVTEYLQKGKPQLETNLVAGMPPPEILEKSEFLEPLPEMALKDYKQLLTGIQKPSQSWIYSMSKYMMALTESFSINPRSS